MLLATPTMTARRPPGGMRNRNARHMPVAAIISVRQEFARISSYNSAPLEFDGSHCHASGALLADLVPTEDLRDRRRRD